MSTPTPTPFNDPSLLPLAFQVRKPLRRFVLLAEQLEEGQTSVNRAWGEMKAPRPSLSSLCNIPAHLDALLRKSFGREVRLYCVMTCGAPIQGLSQDGHVVLRLAIEFLAWLDCGSARAM